VPRLIEKGYTVKGCPVTTIMATARPDNIASCRILEVFMQFTEMKTRYGSQRMWYEYTYT
jgi:hypothetical protein